MIYVIEIDQNRLRQVEKPVNSLIVEICGRDEDISQPFLTICLGMLLLLLCSSVYIFL